MDISNFRNVCLIFLVILQIIFVLTFILRMWIWSKNNPAHSYLVPTIYIIIGELCRVCSI